MQIQVIRDLHVRRFNGDAATPWLTGNRMRWELLKDFIVEIDGEKVIVPEGYVFDGSTTPRLAWPLYPPSHPCAWRGSALHDYGLSHLFRNKPQSYWDDAFYHMMLLDGANKRTAWLFRQAVGLAKRGGYRYAE